MAAAVSAAVEDPQVKRAVIEVIEAITAVQAGASTQTDRFAKAFYPSWFPCVS